MRIAFAIVTLFPGGGLQRDCMALASRLTAKGHHVTIFAARCRGPIPPGLSVELLPNRAWSNSRRDLLFAEAVAQRRHGQFDRLVGFGKLIDLDVLYCADACLAARPAKWYAGLTSRRRIQMQLEAASFSPGKSTQCLLLSQNQAEEFRRAWSTEPDRIRRAAADDRSRPTPPGIQDRRRPRAGPREFSRGRRGCRRCGLRSRRNPKVKGLDRTVAALAAFPAARLAIAGIDNGSKPARQVKALGEESGRRRSRPFSRPARKHPRVDGGGRPAHPSRALRHHRHGDSRSHRQRAAGDHHTAMRLRGARHRRRRGARTARSVLFDRSDRSPAKRGIRGNTHAVEPNGAAYGQSEALFDGLDRAAEIIAGARSD